MDAETKLNRSLGELARLETMTFMDQSEDCHHQAMVNLVSSSLGKLPQGLSGDKAADLASWWRVKFAEANGVDHDQEKDPFHDAVYYDFQQNLSTRLATFEVCRPYLTFLEQSGAKVVVKPLKGLTLAVWEPPDDKITVNSNRTNGTIHALHYFEYTPERAAEILTLRLIPALVHELQHGITDHNLRKILGGSIALPTADDETLSRISEVPAIQMLQELDLQFERPGMVLRLGDYQRLKDFDPKSPQEYIRRWMQKHSRLLSFCCLSDKVILQSLEQDIKNSIEGEALVRERQMLDPEMLEIVIKENNIKRRDTETALSLLSKPGACSEVRDYYIQQFQEFGMSYPGDYPIRNRGIWAGLRRMLPF